MHFRILVRSHQIAVSTALHAWKCMSLSRVQLYSQLYFLKINRLAMERNDRNKLLKSISAITGISDRSLSRVLQLVQQNPEVLEGNVPAHATVCPFLLLHASAVSTAMAFQLSVWAAACTKLRHAVCIRGVDRHDECTSLSFESSLLCENLGESKPDELLQ